MSGHGDGRAVVFVVVVFFTFFDFSDVFRGRRRSPTAEMQAERDGGAAAEVCAVWLAASGGTAGAGEPYRGGTYREDKHHGGKTGPWNVTVQPRIRGINKLSFVVHLVIGAPWFKT